MARAPSWPDTRSPGPGFAPGEVGAITSRAEGGLSLDGPGGEGLRRGGDSVGTGAVAMALTLFKD